MLADEFVRKTTKNFLGVGEKSLGNEAQFGVKKQEVVLYCKDMDKVMTNKEISCKDSCSKSLLETSTYYI